MSEAPTNLDLNRFCNPADGRDYTAKPFSEGAFTYATNGRLIVRIPRRADVADLPAIKPDVIKNLNALWSGERSGFAPPPPFTLPDRTDSPDDCPRCDGRGTEHDCPACTCKCTACEGTGLKDSEADTSIKFDAAYFALRYFRQVLELPGVQLSAADGMHPMHFKFDGGEGILMPRRGEASRHIDIFAPIKENV